ncbi:hypothetical protein JCM6882_009340 [Rhodosporidiobolus microsporus]
MPPTRRSETAPRRSSRAAQIESDKSATTKAAAAKAAAEKKKEESEARKAAAAKKSKSKSKSKTGAKAKAAAARRRPTTTAGRKAAGEASAGAKKRKAEEEGEEEKEAAPPAKKERKAPTDRSVPKEKAPKEPKKPAQKKEKKAADKKEDAEADEPKEVEGGRYKIGDVVEDVKLKNEDDKDVSLAELYAEKGLVIFSYPKANTPGCTTQACNFRDTATAFSEHSFTVLGLSRDKPSAQMSWKSKHELKYSLLSDPEAELLKKLGATEKEKRCHWVIEKGGKLLEAKIGVKPADDAKNALEFVKSLSGDKKEE